MQLALPGLQDEGPGGLVAGVDEAGRGPLAGPVVPLTMTTGNTDELLGGSAAPVVRGDATATGVLVKGDAVSAPRGTKVRR